MFERLTVYDFDTEWKIYRTVTRVGTFDVCVATHVALRMFIMQVMAGQLHFLANSNAGRTGLSAIALASQLHKNRRT